MQHYALTADGAVWSWGHNNYGQLGHGDTANRAVAKRIEFFVQNKIKIATVIPGRPNTMIMAVVIFSRPMGVCMPADITVMETLVTGPRPINSPLFDAVRSWILVRCQYPGFRTRSMPFKTTGPSGSGI